MGEETVRQAAFLIAAMFVARCVGSAQVVETPVPGDPVAIESGLVSGKSLAGGIKAYLGIPFAAPPVRELRWREPHPIQPWKGVYHADRKMPECIQQLRAHNINHYFGEEATSEDCLYANVWAPNSARAGANLPVIVFIYGGGNTIGSSGMALYDGANVARRGAVFVNFNYRVGALGFLAHPELTAESPHHQSGNYGYLDQIAALQWVQRNIAKFGGDPAKVVISGQSAGASAVSLLQASPLAKGLFRGVIAMSGGAWGNGGEVRTLQEAETVGLEVQRALKAASIDAMRQISADRILALQQDWTATSCRRLPRVFSRSTSKTTCRRSWALRTMRVPMSYARLRVSWNTRPPRVAFTASMPKRSCGCIRHRAIRRRARWAAPPHGKRWWNGMPETGRSRKPRMAQSPSTYSCTRECIPTFPESRLPIRTRLLSGHITTATYRIGSVRKMPSTSFAPLGNGRPMTASCRIR